MPRSREEPECMSHIRTERVGRVCSNWYERLVTNHAIHTKHQNPSALLTGKRRNRRKQRPAAPRKVLLGLPGRNKMSSSQNTLPLICKSSNPQLKPNKKTAQRRTGRCETCTVRPGEAPEYRGRNSWNKVLGYVTTM